MRYHPVILAADAMCALPETNLHEHLYESRKLNGKWYGHVRTYLCISRHVRRCASGVAYWPCRTSSRVNLQLLWYPALVLTHAAMPIGILVVAMNLHDSAYSIVPTYLPCMCIS